MLTSILRPTSIALRDAEKLQLIHPPMAQLCRDILGGMERIGYPMTVWEGLRTADQQFEHYKKGRRPGAAHEPGAELIGDKGIWVPIDPVKKKGTVTNADGFVKRSNHQAKPDGKGRAADLIFLVDGVDLDLDLDDPSWAESHPWMLYGTLAEYLGGAKLRWLGRSPTIRDLPHIEWLAD